MQSLQALGIFFIFHLQSDVLYCLDCPTTQALVHTFAVLQCGTFGLPYCVHICFAWLYAHVLAHFSSTRAHFRFVSMCVQLLASCVHIYLPISPSTRLLICFVYVCAHSLPNTLSTRAHIFCASSSVAIFCMCVCVCCAGPTCVCVCACMRACVCACLCVYLSVCVSLCACVVLDPCERVCNVFSLPSPSQFPLAPAASLRVECAATTWSSQKAMLSFCTCSMVMSGMCCNHIAK